MAEEEDERTATDLHRASSSSFLSGTEDDNDQTKQEQDDHCLQSVGLQRKSPSRVLSSSVIKINNDRQGIQLQSRIPNGISINSIGEKSCLENGDSKNQEMSRKTNGEEEGHLQGSDDDDRISNTGRPDSREEPEDQENNIEKYLNRTDTAVIFPEPVSVTEEVTSKGPSKKRTRSRDSKATKVVPPLSEYSPFYILLYDSLV